MKNQKKVKLTVARPDVFTYSNYLIFLKDWLAYIKASQSNFTIQDLAQQSELSISYLSMIFSGTRKLTRNTISKLVQVMTLSKSESLYLESLVTINDSKSSEKKSAAYARMQSLRPYKTLYEEESISYEYLAKWYNVAVRELSALPDFELDTQWIQSHLAFPVGLKEIREGIDFLIKNKLIVLGQNGKTFEPGSTVSYHGGIHSLALAKFHSEMFKLAAQSIEVVSKEDRNILGFTLAVSQENFDQIKTLLDDTYRKIEEIAKQKTNSSKVIHVELALFPLSK